MHTDEFSTRAEPDGRAERVTVTVADHHLRQPSQRPSLLVLALMLVGAWASVATSAPSTTTQASGAVIVDQEWPALHLEVSADAGPDSTGRADLSVEWAATSESGAEPLVSVTTLGSTRVTGRGTRFSQVDVDTPSGELELTVTNIDETGPVTIEWRATASIDGSDVDLSIASEGVPTRPSSAVSLPSVRPSYSRVRVPHQAFAVDVEFAATDSVTIERTDLDDISDVVAVVGDELTAIQPGINDVPTSAAECHDGRCALTFALAVTSVPSLRVEITNGDGSITAVVRELETEVAWIALPPLRILSEVADVSIDVAMPADPDNPFAGHATLVTRVPDAGDPISRLNCFGPVEYSIAGQPYTEVVSFVHEEVGGRPISIDGGTTSRVDLRIGTIDPGQYCDADPDNETVLEIGVMTLGLTDVRPAEVTR